jgi:hypothetical protein
MADQSPRRTQPAPTQDEARTTDDLPPDELSHIAREAVRQPADPRIDAHLARMGLTGDPDVAATPPTAAKPAPPTLPDLAPEVAALRASVTALEARLDLATGRLRLVSFGLVAVAVVAAIALVLALR